MIVSKLEINLSDEGNEVEIGRKVALGGEREEIVRDLKAVGYALAESARRRKLEEPKESAERIQFEQALAEGFRMDADEAEEMDRAAAENRRKDPRRMRGHCSRRNGGEVESMSEPNIDELREQASAEIDPQFQPDPESLEKAAERAEEYVAYLYDILDSIYEAERLIQNAKETLQTRRLNETARILSEAEDKVDELLERGF